MSSSTPVRTRLGSARRRSISDGLRSRASIPLPTRFMVVSKPATKSRVTVLSSSAWVRRSPSASAAIRALSRSGPGLPAALLDQVGEVAEQLHAGGHALHEGGLVEVVVEQAGGPRGPSLEALPVGDGHAQQLADHDRRQGVGQVGQHVELAVAPLHHRVEQLVDQPLDAGLEAVDGPGGEGLADQPPQAGVVGRVEEHHQVRARLAHRALLDRSTPSPSRAGLVLNRGSRSTAAAWS